MTLPHSATAADTAPFDLILRGGAVIDGTGTPPRPGDIGVRGDRVVALGDLGDAPANRVLDIPGCFVCPGFIDIHTHSDISVLFTPGMESSLRQGVTTEVVGNCGFSLCLAQGGSENPDFTWEQGLLRRGGITLDWSDLPGFARRIEENGVAINVATLVGHGTLRKRAMGLAERKPDADEMRTMQADLAAALEAGAVGLSSGLEYVPGMYADIAEMTLLAKLAGEAGKFYATQLRDEGDIMEEADAEAIAVAEASGTPLQLSHHKAERPRNWGKVARTLAQVDAAQARGTDILLDQYPYTAYQTNLATIVLPAWAMGGTPDALAEKLRDPAVRERVRAAMEGVDYRSVEIAAYGPFRDYQGRTVAEIAESAGQDPRDWLLDLFSVGESFASAVHHALSEEDVERV